MTEKEKANHLVETYYNVWAFNNTFSNFNYAKIKKTKAYRMSVRSAGIAVDEILNIDVWAWPHNAEQGVLYWEDVKKEINNL